jgi:hypothetical protein
MAEVKKYDLLLVDGGLNVDTPATHIGDNEAQDVENLYVFAQARRRRAGTEKLTSTAAPEQLTGIFAYKTSVGVWQLLLPGLTRMFFLDGNVITQIPHVSGATFDSSPAPWSAKQYKNVAYFGRQGSGGLLRCDGQTVGPAGIAAPTTACVLSDGGAGSIGAGDYQAVVQFVNRSTGAESDFGPVSNKLTLGANKKITYSSIPVSSNPQVNGRRLFRTLKNSSGEYLFDSEVTDNFSTTYTSDVVDTALGRSASTSNGLPPSQVIFMELFREHLFVTDGRDLYPSRTGFPESFDSEFRISVYADDGHAIRGLLAYGDRMLIGKTNQVHYIVGTDESDFALRTLSDKHGCVSGYSMKTTEGLAFWYEGEDVIMTDGQSVKGIGIPRIRKILEAEPVVDRYRAIGWIVPRIGWYVLSLPSGKELVYNFRSQGWDVFKRGTLGSAYYADEVFGSDLERKIYAVFTDGHLYELESGNTDDGQPIVCKWRSKEFGFAENATLKAIRKLSALIPLIPENATFRLYRDSASTPFKSRTLYLGDKRPWKRLSLSNAKDLATTVSIGLEYSGATPLSFNGLKFEILDTGRPPENL